MAAKAYDYFNADLAGSGLELRTPETIRDARKAEIPLLIERVRRTCGRQGALRQRGPGRLHHHQPRRTRRLHGPGGALRAVHRPKPHRELVLGFHHPQRRFYHVGTVPNERGEIFVADLRMSICATASGFMPLAVYARRAPQPLTPMLHGKDSSWEMLGTNLSRKQPDGSWLADIDRLLMMDTRDFNTLGLGIDDLIEAFVQTVLATIAIDRMAANLLNQKGELRRKLFASLDGDNALMGELHG